MSKLNSQALNLWAQDPLTQNYRDGVVNVSKGNTLESSWLSIGNIHHTIQHKNSTVTKILLKDEKVFSEKTILKTNILRVLTLPINHEWHILQMYVVTLKLTRTT